MATSEGLVWGRGDLFFSLTLSPSNPTAWMELERVGGSSSSLTVGRRRGAGAGRASKAFDGTNFGRKLCLRAGNNDVCGCRSPLGQTEEMISFFINSDSTLRLTLPIETGRKQQGWMKDTSKSCHDRAELFSSYLLTCSSDIFTNTDKEQLLQLFNTGPGRTTGRSSKISLRLQLLDSARAGGDAREEYGSGEEHCHGSCGGGESCGGEPPCGHRVEATVRRRRSTAAEPADVRKQEQTSELESDENGKEESTCDDWLGAAVSERRRGGLAWRGEERLERSEGRKRI
uniref:Uncharacterized protein n=1 Tax=Oryza nivara TaxID=4536 RepID=A0A0E0HM91_ORYNI